MKGSIRFDNEINVEVEVDPSQDEGARLLSAVNLVDGQELGSGGGGGSGVILLYEGDIDASTTSSSGTVVAEITENSFAEYYNAGIPLLILIKDNAGKRNSHYYGQLTITGTPGPVTGSSYYINADGTEGYASNSFGIIPSFQTNHTKLVLTAKYTNAYGTFDGNFHVSVYAIPDITIWEADA